MTSVRSGFLALVGLVLAVMVVMPREMATAAAARKTQLPWSAVWLDKSWTDWKRRHRHEFTTYGEEAYRRLQWEANVAYVQRHNLRQDAGLETYTVGVNAFAHLSWPEFRASYLNGNRKRFSPVAATRSNLAKNTNRQHSSPQRIPYQAPANTAIPIGIDWRRVGTVTHVKNQGDCGSCWAFSTTGALEGQYARMKRRLVSLSEQQLIDCSRSFGNRGCGGGSMDNAANYVSQFGIESEAAYPYLVQEQSCHYNKRDVLVKVAGIFDLQPGNETSLMQATAHVGPISVAIDADHKGFMLYRSGIYTEPSCSTTQLDHGVLNIGYDVDPTTNAKYWLVKNSWGADWGDAGYIKMARDRNNMCGIASMASFPTIY